MISFKKKVKYDKDYFENGIAKNISCYENYRWLPELTYPMAYSVADCLKLKKNDCVLEYGCAHGYLVKALNDFGINAFGLDISEYALKNCPSDIKNKVNIIKKDNLPKALKKFKIQKKIIDYTISKDVMEHIEKNKLPSILKKLSKCSKYLFVVVPLGDKSKYRIDTYHLDKTHLIAENEKWWTNLFKANGFKLTKFKYKIDGIKDKWYKINKKGNGFFFLKSKNI